MVSLFPIRRGWKPKPKLNGDSIKKSRGRPKKNPEMVTVKPIRLSQDMIENFDLWKTQYHVKTYDEAIRMRLADRSHEITKLRKKVEAQDMEISGLRQRLAVLNQWEQSLKRIESRQTETQYQLHQRVKHREELIATS